MIFSLELNEIYSHEGNDLVWLFQLINLFCTSSCEIVMAGFKTYKEPTNEQQ